MAWGVGESAGEEAGSDDEVSDEAILALGSNTSRPRASAAGVPSAATQQRETGDRPAPEPLTVHSELMGFIIESYVAKKTTGRPPRPPAPSGKKSRPNLRPRDTCGTCGQNCKDHPALKFASEVGSTLSAFVACRKCDKRFSFAHCNEPSQFKFMVSNAHGYPESLKKHANMLVRQRETPILIMCPVCEAGLETE